MSGLCRICMFPKFDLINLVKDGTDTLERSGEKFEDCFGIKVKELPYCQRICKDCDKQLIDFYYFKQQALRTHNYMIDKAYDLQPSWPGVKEDMDVTDVEIIDDTPTIKQEKNHIEYTEDTLSEVLDSYKQIAPLMYEVANESISEDKIEMEGVALNTKDNEGEVDKVDKMIKDYTLSAFTKEHPNPTKEAKKDATAFFSVKRNSESNMANPLSPSRQITQPKVWSDPGSHPLNTEMLDAVPPPPPRYQIPELYNVTTTDGVSFQITHEDLQRIPLNLIRASKRKRRTIFLQDGRKVRLKICGTKLIWFNLKAANCN